MMENYNLVPRAKRSIESAIDIANTNKHSKVNSAHLLCAIIDNSTANIRFVFDKVSLNPENLRKALLLELKRINPEFFTKKRSEKSISDNFAFMIEKAKEFSDELDQHFIGVEHLFYAIFKYCEVIRDFLEKKEVPLSEVLKLTEEILDPSPQEQKESDNNSERSDDNEEKKSKFISKYCSNLNDSVLKYSCKIQGREEELEKLIEILSCKIKNNSILVGDAGVGKTAIVEALAQRINSFECPIFFSGFKIYSLDLGLMVAGTKYRGQFEERFKGLIEELKQDDRSILFIDEIHSIVGAGSTEGTLDLANMIKPALARGEIKCIGATTSAEYKKYFEKDSALSRRFQTLNISEPSKEQTFNILSKAKSDYEKFHGVEYSDEILNNIITLAEKYMPYKKFPDKAFDILDRIGAKAKIEKFVVPVDIKEMESKLLEIMASDETDRDLSKIECEDLLKIFVKERNSWLDEINEKSFAINNNHLYEVLSKVSGLNKDKIELNSSKQFTSFKQEIETKVYDQSEVIEKIYKILLCAKAGIKKNKKTIANFLFVGSTGVGKTYTAKVIAEKFFDKPNSFLQIDMAEYVEKNSISKLLGASAGYVGYEEGGLLSEFVRNNPNSLILFDEIDKANPELVNILLKIMDEGEIIDNFNRKIDFSNTIIVLTGNVGAEHETSRSMGFVDAQLTQNRGDEYLKSVKKHFKPELLARLDEVLIFNSKFSKTGLCNMIQESLLEICDSLSQKNIKLKSLDKTQDYLYELVSKQGLNARAVKNVLRDKFELPLCEFIVSHEDILEIDSKVVDNELVFM